MTVVGKVDCANRLWIADVYLLSPRMEIKRPLMSQTKKKQVPIQEVEEFETPKLGCMCFSHWCEFVIVIGYGYGYGYGK